MANIYALHLGTPPNTILIGSLKPPLNFSGAWDSTVIYPVGFVVTSGGNFFQALVVNQNVTPTDGATWKQLSVGGATTTGTSFAVPNRPGSNKKATASEFTWEVITTGTAITVKLEGSLDNQNWFVLDTYTTAAGGNALQVVVTNPVNFLRAHITSTDSGTTVVLVQL